LDNNQLLLFLLEPWHTLHHKRLRVNRKRQTETLDIRHLLLQRAALQRQQYSIALE
jgi:hypothetical protein